MTIDLDPELERLVQEDVATGAFSSVNEFMRRAVMELLARRLRSADSDRPKPLDEDWQWLRDLRAKGVRFDDDMVAAVEEEVAQQRDRPDLDAFFS